MKLYSFGWNIPFLAEGICFMQAIMSNPRISFHICKKMKITVYAYITVYTVLYCIYNCISVNQMTPKTICIFKFIQKYVRLITGYMKECAERLWSAKVLDKQFQANNGDNLKWWRPATPPPLLLPPHLFKSRLNKFAMRDTQWYECHAKIYFKKLPKKDLGTAGLRVYIRKDPYFDLKSELFLDNDRQTLSSPSSP